MLEMSRWLGKNLSFFLVQIVNMDWIESGARHLKKHLKISKFTKFDGFGFERKDMVPYTFKIKEL